MSKKDDQKQTTTTKATDVAGVGCAAPAGSVATDPEPRKCTVDINLLNNPERLRERADAIEAANRGEPVDKWCDGAWIQLESITAFFFDRRYRARPLNA